MSRLAGKRAIVTGAGSGLGAAIAKAFADEGAQVLGFDIRYAAPRRDFPMTAVEGDVRDTAAVNAAVERAANEFGGIDVLCNAAGIAAFGRVEEIDEIDLAAVMDVNFYGPFRFIKAAVPHLLASPGGSIINIASVGAIRSRPNLSGYAASKAALLGLSRGIAIDYADQGISVNSILPGVFDTPMIGSAEGVAARAARGQPAGRVGRPSEIAALAVLLASDDCRYATGSEFIVDGGRSAT